MAQVGSVQLSHSKGVSTDQQNESFTSGGLTTEAPSDPQKVNTSEFSASIDPEVENENSDDDDSNLPASPDTLDLPQATAVQRSHFSVDETGHYDDRILHHLASVKLYKPIENNYDQIASGRFLEYEKKDEASTTNKNDQEKSNEKIEKEKSNDELPNDQKKSANNEFLNTNVRDFFDVQSTDRISNRPLAPSALSTSYHEEVVGSAMPSSQKKWTPNQNRFTHKYDDSNVGVLRPVLTEYAYPATYESLNAATTSRTKHLANYGMPEVSLFYYINWVPISRLKFNFYFDGILIQFL